MSVSTWEIKAIAGPLEIIVCAGEEGLVSVSNSEV